MQNQQNPLANARIKVSVLTVDACGDLTVPLAIDAIYRCSVTADGGYGIIVIDDIMRLPASKSLGTFGDEGLTLYGFGGSLDYKGRQDATRTDLNAETLFLVTGTSPKGLPIVTLYQPTA